MRILVIEDEPDLLAVLARALREEGYAVDEASDGATGLQKALDWPYDAIVLDLMLPQMDGWEVMRRLRQHHKVPVLILTARDAVSDRVRGLDQGADDYLVKPFAIHELFARLRAMIRRSAGHANSKIEIGDIVVDMASKKILQNGMEVPLTPREFALVEILALNRGKLISRTVIYDHIFGEEDTTLSNLLDVHVSHIRKKLGKDFIVTRRGQGYMIDA